MSDRPVQTDALATLGTVIDDTQKRDAIHLAVIPVQVQGSQPVYAGQHVDQYGNPNPLIPPNKPDNPFVGIVDPFLAGPVYPGQWFWLVIYPRKITSLRHVWDHPLFPAEVQAVNGAKTPAELLAEIKTRKKLTPIEHAVNIESIKLEAAKQFIRNEADSVGLSYQRLIDAAGDYLDHGDYVTGGDEMEGAYTSSEFWDHFEVVTGRVVDPKDRGSFFSCSC